MWTRRWTTTGIKPQTFDEATLRAAVVDGDRGEPEGGGRLQGAARRRREDDRRRGDEGEQGAPNDVVRRLVDEELAKV